MSVQVAVVGGGIIGVSSAYRILREVPGVSVTIFAEKASPETTGDGAAGLWGPFLDGGTPAHKVNAWSKATHDLFQHYWLKGEATSVGVCLVGVQRLADEDEPDPSWKDVVYGFRHYSSQEAAQLAGNNETVKHGWEYVTYTCECKKMIPHLLEKFQELGGEFVKAKVTDLKLLGQRFDLIVNCSGLGAKDLVGDQTVRPKRGQLIRVKAPWQKMAFMMEVSSGADDRMPYCIPNTHVVGLGGTYQVDNWNTSPSSEDKKYIKESLPPYLPSMLNAEEMEDWVGLRPARDGGVRLEKDKILVNGKIIPEYFFRVTRTTQRFVRHVVLSVLSYILLLCQLGRHLLSRILAGSWAVFILLELFFICDGDANPIPGPLPKPGDKAKYHYHKHKHYHKHVHKHKHGHKHKKGGKSSSSSSGYRRRQGLEENPAGGSNRNLLPASVALPYYGLNPTARAVTSMQATRPLNSNTMSPSLVVDLRVLEAALESDWTTVRKLLPAARDMDMADQDGWSVLHFACREGIDDVVRLCLMKGADVDRAKKNLWTGLHLAARNQKPSTAEVLLRAGANPNARNDRGNTPLLLNLLVQGGAEVNMCGEDGKTSLHKAAERGYDEAVLFLLRNGADTGIKDAHGNTPIVLAIAAKNQACIQILEKAESNKLQLSSQEQSAVQQRQENMLPYQSQGQQLQVGALPISDRVESLGQSLMQNNNSMQQSIFSPVKQKLDGSDAAVYVYKMLRRSILGRTRHCCRAFLSLSFIVDLAGDGGHTVGSRSRGNPSVASSLGYTAQQLLHANPEADRAPGLPHCGKPGQEQREPFPAAIAGSRSLRGFGRKNYYISRAGTEH
ncbi:unnamed protein product, partial [Notodromas monacha]